MCGCPAHGCLEAIPSGGEYKSTVSASDPIETERERETFWSNDHF